MPDQPTEVPAAPAAAATPAETAVSAATSSPATTAAPDPSPSTARPAPIVHGSCLCGDVRFGAALPTLWVAHCHCSFCRRAHGAAFVTWAGFRAEQVSVDAGASAPRWHVSSPGAERGFCARCGSPMFFRSTRWPGEMHVARALIDEALDREPSAHVFYERHVPWLQIADGLPRKVSTG